jgi:iron complex outermembrane receptor protein
MNGDLRRGGHPLLAALLIAGIGGVAQAESPETERPEPASIARSEELELLKEEETVSIASRYEQPISQAPSNVYVITDEDIRQSGATDLPTVLRRVPGIEVMQMSGADFNVSVRGDNQPSANKMLVLVDGRSIYVDVQATVFWKAIPVTLPEIKRIEVLKGPASAVYGFNAFDGVINIITKSPEEMKGTTLQFGGGELGTISSAAVHAGTTGNFGYRLSVGRDQNQQWRNHDALAFRSNKFNVLAQYALSPESKLAISGGLTDVNRFDGQISEIVSPSTPFSQAYTNVGYERPNFFLRAWWSEFVASPIENINPAISNFVRLTDRSGSSTFPFFGNTYNVEGQHVLELGRANRLTYGINYRHNSLSSGATDEFSRENRLGFYLNEEWRATDKLTLLSGLRYDLDTFIHPTTSPRIALLYTPIPDHTFRVAVSVAYRPPTLFETHADLRAITTVPTGLPPPFPPTFSTTVPVVGSTGLDPEQIVSYEAGYQGWYLKHRLRARADLFFNHITDLIGNRNVPSGVASFVNDQGQADIYGGEAGVEILATKWLTGFANFSYQEIGQSFQGTIRRGAPRFKYNLGLRGEWDNGVSAEALFHHVGSATYPIAATFTQLAPFGAPIIEPRVGSYNLLNMRAGYRFWQQRAAAGYMRDAEVAVSVFNALDDQHKEHPLGDTIGRRVMGWITVKF